MATSRADSAVAWIAALAAFVFLVTVPASVALRGSPEEAPRLPGVVTARVAAIDVLVKRALDGAALGDATVRVFWENEGRYYFAGGGRTDASGRASLSDLPVGAAWILVEAKDYARRSTALVLGAGRRTVAVGLTPASVLDVHVEDDAHAPVASATVLANGADALPFGALTDLGGGAHFARLSAGPWKLRVFARGYEPESVSDVLGNTTVTLRRASALDVRVVAGDGKPVVHAAVFVAGSGLWPARRVETNAEGRAHIGGITAGAYDVKAELGDLVSKTELGVSVARGESHAVELTLVPGHRIPIIVTDGDGDHPLVVADADVLLVEGGVSSFPLQGRTDRFGKVQLGPVADGEFVATARADGFVPHGAVAVPAVVTTEVRIPLLRGGTLRGDVVDKEGRPVDGATVEVVGTDTDGMPIAATPLAAEFQRAHFAWALAGPSPLLEAGELGVTTGPVPPIPGAGAAALPIAPATWDTSVVAAEPWVTAFDGSFRAAPISPGRVRALVRHPAYVEATSEMVTLGPGGEARVRVVLRPGGSVEGSVVDEAGLPVAGARIEVAAVAGTLSRVTTSADDGTFALSAMPQELLVTVARPDEPYRAVVRKQLAVPDGGKLEVMLVVPALRDPMEVSVEDDSRRPVKMAQVTALSLDPERPLRFTDFTDDAGRATIRDATGLPLRLVVEAPGFARHVDQMESAPSSTTVELVSGVLIEGHVTAVRGRRDVEGATVEVLAEGHRRVTVTNALGVFQFSDVSPGTVHLRVSHPEYATTEVDAAVEGTGRADRAFDVAPIDLEEPGSIAGRVVDESDHPVAGARVGVGTVGAYLSASSLAFGTVTTKADGAYFLDRVRPGKVDVEAILAGAGRGRVAGVAVDAGHTAEDVVIRLSPIDDAESAATGGVAITLAETRKIGQEPKIIVTHVAEGSEAEHAGIVAGDVLTAVDRAAPTSLADARKRLAGPDGSDVVVDVVRGDEKNSLRVRRERIRR